MSLRTFNRFMACLTVVFFLLLITASAVAADTIPARAYQYRHILHAEIRRQWGLNMPDIAVAVGAGTIHQESAWSPRAQSPYAKGLTQFTDPTWKDIIKSDPSIAEIGDVWNPHAAIRAMARYHRLLWKQFDAPDLAPHASTWPFLLSGYNGGPGWVRKDQRLCATKEGLCDPSVWWGNVEKYSSRAPQFIKENRHYVSNILKRWVPLYRNF